MKPILKVQEPKSDHCACEPEGIDRGGYRLTLAGSYYVPRNFLAV